MHTLVFQLYSTAILLYICVCPFFSRFFTPIVYYIILSGIPCAMQKALVGYLCCCCCCCVASVVSDSVRPHRWQPTRLLCPWDSPCKNTGVGCHFLLQLFWSTSLQLGTIRCSRLTLDIYCLRHRVSSLSNHPWFFSLKNDVINLDPGGIQGSLTICPLSWQSKKMYVSKLTCWGPALVDPG